MAIGLVALSVAALLKLKKMKELEREIERLEHQVQTFAPR